MPVGRSERNAAGVANDIGTSPDFIQITAFTSQDLMTLGPGQASLPRGLIVSDLGAGTKILEVITAAGNTRTIDATNLLAAYLPGCIKALTANTTVGKVLLFY